MNKFAKLAAAAALVCAGAANAGTVATVDLFSANQAKLTDATTGDGGLSSQVGPDALTILGGYRDLSIELKQNLTGAATSSISVSGGLLQISNDVGAASTAIVRWDGSNSGASINTSGLGGANISNGDPTAAFEIMTVSADAGFTFVIEAYTQGTATDATGSWSKVSITSNAHAFSLPGTKSYISLLGFLDCTNSIPFPGVTVSCGATPVDFTNLGALQVVVDPLGKQVDLDLSLNQIVTTVPEPGAIALVGLAMLGAGVASRRRKA